MDVDNDDFLQFIRNRGNRQNVPDADEKDCSSQSANPIIVTTGNKIEPEIDFESFGEMPLTLRRTYNGFWKYPGLFGRYWVSSFDYSLVWQTVFNGGDPITVIFAQRPDGRRIRFMPYTADRWNEDKAQSVAYVMRNADGTYTLYSEGLALETYDGGGRPLTIKSWQGIGWTFSYTNNFLTRVAHTSGRFVQFGWNGGQLTQVTAPDGSVFTYTYTANAFGAGKHRLASAVSPAVAGGNEATSVEYFYEDTRFPGALTGKAYQGARYSRFAYDDQRRATLSEHVVPGGSVDKYTFSYSGSDTTPTNPPNDPPPPGWTCNPVTHICYPPVLAPHSDDPEVAANEAAALQEAALIDVIMATVTTTETNPYGKITKYTATDGRLTSVIGEASANCPRRAASTSYDANGYENLVKDFNGNTVDYDYNAKGQLTQKIEGSGSATPRTTTYGWDPTYNRMTRETVVGDHETTYVYGADHRLASVAIKNLSANGVARTHTWVYTYAKYPSGLVQTMAVDGPRTTDDRVTYSYNATGDLTKISDSFGNATTYGSYNGLGQPGRMTGPNGDIADYAYYPGGALKEVKTYPGGIAASTRYTYGYGALFTITTPDAITTWLAYDQARRLWRVTRNEMNGLADRRISYNAASDPVSETIYRGDGATLRYRSYTDYDELGRVIGRRGNNGQNVRYAYDLNDNLTSVTDSLNRVTSFTYDALNRLSTKTDTTRTGVTRYEYDAGNRIKKVTDPRNLITSYTYDGLDQLWTQVSPDSGTTVYDYNDAGNRIWMTRANGVATRYVYDQMGRLSSATANGQVRAYGYDTCTNGKGRLCGVTSPNNILRYQYEADGRIRTRQDMATVGGVQSSYTTSYGYDSIGRLTRFGYPNGQAANYAYTTGQLAAMTLTVGATTTNLITSASYEPFGAVAGWTYGNGLTRSYGRDLNQRLTSLSTKNGASALQSLTYSYTLNNQINQITDGVAPSLTESYGYDELSRLSSRTADGATTTYVYDKNGNRTSASNGWVHTISPTSNRMTGTNVAGAGSTFASDGAGNTLNYVVPNAFAVNYGYDPFNQMESVSGGSAYGYNGYGERTTKQAFHGQYRYQYDEAQRLLSEHKDQGDVWTNYLWFGGERIGLVRGSAVYYLHNDHLGRPERATSATKATVWQANNGAFGDRAVTVDAIGGLNVGLPGQYFDAESNLYYNVNRYYEPVHSRYWQADPIGLAGGSPSLYTYADGDPVNAVDSLGLETCLLTTVGPGGIRDHAAIYTSRGDGTGGPAIYDPAGSYSAANGGGSGDILEGDVANVDKFKNFHKGQEVESACKKTSQKEEENIIANALNLPSAFPFQCAIRSSTALSGQPSFPGVIPGTWFPGNLRRQVEQGP